MLETSLSIKSYQPFTHSHQHNFHQLVMPVTGTLNLEIGKTCAQVNSEHAALICAEQNHAFQARGNNQFIVADIPVQLAPAFDLLPTFMPLDNSIKQYITFLQQYLNTNNYQHNATTHRHILLLLVQLLDDKFANTPLIDKRIVQARQFLAQHFQQKNCIQNAANYAGISERHLRQLFTQYYSTSPSQFLLDVRMQFAYKLLKTTTNSIQLIAEKCGYANTSAFSSRFHKHFSTRAADVRRFNKQKSRLA